MSNLPDDQKSLPSLSLSPSLSPSPHRHHNTSTITALASLPLAPSPPTRLFSVSYSSIPTTQFDSPAFDPLFFPTLRLASISRHDPQNPAPRRDLSLPQRSSRRHTIRETAGACSYHRRSFLHMSSALAPTLPASSTEDDAGVRGEVSTTHSNSRKMRCLL